MTENENRAFGSLCRVMEARFDDVQILCTENKAWYYLDGEEFDCTDEFSYLKRKAVECHVGEDGRWLDNLYE